MSAKDGEPMLSDSASSSSGDEQSKLKLAHINFPVMNEQDLHTNEHAEQEEEEEEVEFHLFAPSKTSAPARIRIQSPAATSQPPGLLRSKPPSYYFWTPSPRLQSSLAASVLTPSQVLAHSRRSCPGMRMPWKVSVIPASAHRVRSATATAGEGGRKARKGKKTRIAIRKKARREEERARIQKVAEGDRELAERMKRASRNRSKKLRQRAKEKERKAGEKGLVDGAGGEVGD